MNNRYKKILRKIESNIVPLIALVAIVAILFTTIAVSQDRPGYEESRHDTMVVVSGDTKATFSLTSGANKPIISKDGDVAVEYSGWASSIDVNGENRNLWQHGFGYSKSSEQNIAYYTRSGDGYEIQQEVALSDGRAIIKYYLVADEASNINSTTLAIGHYRHPYDSIQFTDGKAIAKYSADGKQRSVTINFSDNLVSKSKDASSSSPKWFNTKYRTDGVKPGKKKLIAEEVVIFDN
jgi:hypothetical protein